MTATVADVSFLVLEGIDRSGSSLTQLRVRREYAVRENRRCLDELRETRRRMSDLVDGLRSGLALNRAYRSTPDPHAAATHEPTTTRKLSKREVSVLKHVAAGLSNKEIAVRLGISPVTVRNHMSGIFTKLVATNRTEAVIAAVRSGLLKV